MLKMITVLMMAVFITACASQPPVEAYKEVVINHPTMPRPINHYTFKWRVITLEDGVYIGLPYDKSLDFRLMMEDTARYIKDSQSVICFYRKDLNDPQCKKPIKE